MSPRLEDEIAARGLDPAQADRVRRFAQDGYVVLDDLGLGDVDELAARVRSDLAPLHEDGAYNRVADAWTVSDDVREIALAPKVVPLLELLYGRRPIPFQTLNFWRGSQQHTHSDAVHFHAFPRNMMCGVWVALEDTDENNGALHYYPGSHLLPDYAEFGIPHGEAVHGDFDEYMTALIEAEGLRKERPSLRRGQALVWAAGLLHGGDPVVDAERTRVSQVTHYYFDDCSYYNPVRSDIARGKIFFRQIVDVGTGRLHPNTLNGGSVAVPLSSRLVTWQRALMRRLGRGVQRHVK
jgi:Phytanoyl-CoA dioxygenase (PhyH)